MAFVVAIRSLLLQLYGLAYAVGGVIFAEELDEESHDLLKYDVLKILLHLSGLFRGQVLEELADADFDALLA